MVRGVSLARLLLQGESVERGAEVVVEDFGPGILEDPKAPEKAGLPPLATAGGVEFFGGRWLDRVVDEAKKCMDSG